MAFDNGKIRPAARERFVRAAENNSLYVAAISLFEVADLAHKKRIELSIPLKDWFHLSFSEPGLQIAALSPDIAVESSLLPPEFHGDPADRLIAATPTARGMVLCTHDRALLRFGQQGLYKFLEV
jgi:PIN domain nuclease of toxin-antitoxin system